MILMIMFTAFSITLALARYSGIRNATGFFALYVIVGGFLPYTQVLFSDQPPSGFFRYIEGADGDKALAVLVFASIVAILIGSVRLSTFEKGVSNKNIAYSIDAKLTAYIFAISIACLTIYLCVMAISYGGMAQFTGASYRRAQLLNSTVNYFSLVSWGGICGTTIAFHCYRRLSKKPVLTALAIISVSLCTVVTLASGGRSVFILFIFGLFLDKIVSARPLRLFAYASAGVVFTALASYMMLTARYRAQGASILDQNAPSIIEGALTGTSYVDHVAISIQYAESEGYDYGQSYINAFLSFIPRSIYSDKPQLLSAEIRAFLFGDYSGGVPPGIFGEGYIALGIFGVTIIALLYGIVLRRTNRLVRNAMITNCPLRYACAGIIIPLVGFVLVRGGVDIGVFRVGIPLFWIFVFVTLIHRFNKTRSTASGSN
ncbi:O-antigen polymerase [Oceanicaulis sp.]|uniref:O-antigen polymerase n=1 Tax=Oceanicaulis sp. TaxID=1924941 RepID=UPI003BA9F4DE